jgi:FRG domain
LFSTSVKDITEYVAMIEGIPFVNEFSVYRGQAVKQNLLPSVARKDPTKDMTETKRAMLRQMSLMGAALLAPGGSDLDHLVAAQHFGMKTRLLDWTSNPLAALWFACSGQDKGDSYVYALSTSGLLLEDAYAIDPFSLSATKVFQPRLNNPRVLAQHGWFTLHSFSSKNERWVRLEANTKAKNELMEIVIPAKYRSEMMRALDRHGVSARTLFPDLSGLCQHLNWTNAA